MTEASDRRLGTILRLAAHPLSLLWLLGAIAVAGGAIEWVFFDRSPWEGFGAALVIAGVTKTVAHVKGVAAWPWEK